MEGLGLWSYFAVELGFIAVYALIFKSHFSLMGKGLTKAGLAWAIPLNLVLGVMIYRGAGMLELTVPFDFSQPELLWLMILMGPITEELIFRFLFWLPFDGIVRSKWFVIAITSVFFSLSHFWAIFDVAEIFKPFVLYQAMYTLLLALHWGERRHASGGLLVPIILHVVLNAGFAAAGYYEFRQYGASSGAQATNLNALGNGSLTADALRVVVIDMNVDEDQLKVALPNIKNFEIRRSPQLDKRLDAWPENFHQEMLQSCNANLKDVEKLMVGQALDFTQDDIVRVSRQVVFSHGYHVASVVLKNLVDVEFLYLALTPPPALGISDAEDYSANDVRAQMAWVAAQIDDFHPDLVVAATSETVEENEKDLMAGYGDRVSASDLRSMAEKIAKLWNTEWGRIISSNSDTLFVFPSGNGGIDGVGDEIYEGGVFPASIVAKNKVNIASSPKVIDSQESCLSGFSNWASSASTAEGLRGVFFAPGELIRGASGCSNGEELELSGTSQAAAVWARMMLEEMILMGGDWQKVLSSQIRSMTCSRAGSPFEIFYVVPSQQ